MKHLVIIAVLVAACGGDDFVPGATDAMQADTKVLAPCDRAAACGPPGMSWETRDACLAAYLSVQGCGEEANALVYCCDAGNCLREAALLLECVK